MDYTKLQKWFRQPYADKDVWILRLSEHDKNKLINALKNVNKLESRLKMIEISFEQINNSRNYLIEQLTECELALEEKNGL